MSDEPIILRRLKTRDGIVSAIEELPEYRRDEWRALYTRIHAYAVKDEDTGVPVDMAINCRRYKLRKQRTAILLEMEEE